MDLASIFVCFIYSQMVAMHYLNYYHGYLIVDMDCIFHHLVSICNLQIIWLITILCLLIIFNYVLQNVFLYLQFLGVNGTANIA